MKWQYRWTAGSTEPTLWYDFDEQRHLEFTPSPGRNLEWRQVEKYVFKVGDVITTTKNLEALPTQSVVRDDDDDAWLKTANAVKPWRWQDAFNSSEALLDYSNVEVIFLPRGYPGE
jgi:hypothetical protein